MENRPEALFKYLPYSRISVLQDLLIRFTQVSSLNDTLELRPPVKGVATTERLEEIARNGLSSSLCLQTNQKIKKILDRRCPGLTELVGEILLQQTIGKCTEAIQQRHERNPQAVYDVTDKNFGIFSLSETPYDVRMWGHYADGGRGFLIEFDPEHAWFHGKKEERDSFRHIRKVNYISVRPAKYLLDTTEEEFLYTKWNVWEDEKEWRIIRNFNDAAKIGDRPDPYGNEIILFSIPPDSVKSVVLGFSASNEFEKKIYAILSENSNLNHIIIKRAIQSSETGQVEIIPFSISKKS